MDPLLSRLRDATANLVALPALVGIAIGGLAVALVEWPGAFSGVPSALLFGGDAEAARSVLTTVAASVMTVAGLTFSITIVALQLASTQFSPRVLRTFFSDRITQVTAGTFIGIVGYALLVLRAVRTGTDGGPPTVPRFAVTVAIALCLVALVLLLVLVQHVAGLVQVSRITARIAEATHDRLARRYPGRFGTGQEQEPLRRVAGWRDGGEAMRIVATRSGFVRRVEPGRLGRRSTPPLRAHVLVAPGDFVARGQALLDVWPHDATVDDDRLREVVHIATERTLEQDVGFGIRQLADVALRALSPSVNDPTTAITCIGYLRSILVDLAGRDCPPARHRLVGDREVVTVERGFTEYRAPLREIGRAARSDPRVTTVLLDACEAIADAARQAGARDRAAAVLSEGVDIAGDALTAVPDEGGRSAMRVRLVRLDRCLRAYGEGGRRTSPPAGDGARA